MQALLVCGRLLLVLAFAFAGAQKLLDISGTASVIAGKLVFPPALIGAAGYVEATTGMSMPQFLAIVIGAVELAAAILIVFNVGIRPMAIVLIIFTAAGIYYFNDFWNMTGDARTNGIGHALQNLSIIGAILLLLAIGSSQPGQSERTSDL